MITYKVIDPNGVLVDGRRIQKDDALPSGASTSQVKAFLRFKQIEAVESVKKIDEPKDEPKAEPVVILDKPKGKQGRPRKA